MWRIVTDFFFGYFLVIDISHVIEEKISETGIATSMLCVIDSIKEDADSYKIRRMTINSDQESFGNDFKKLNPYSNIKIFNLVSVFNMLQILPFNKMKYIKCSYGVENDYFICHIEINMVQDNKLLRYEIKERTLEELIHHTARSIIRNIYPNSYLIYCVAKKRTNEAIELGMILSKQEITDKKNTDSNTNIYPFYVNLLLSSAISDSAFRSRIDTFTVYKYKADSIQFSLANDALEAALENLTEVARNYASDFAKAISDTTTSNKINTIIQNQQGIQDNTAIIESLCKILTCHERRAKNNNDTKSRAYKKAIAQMKTIPNMLANFYFYKGYFLLNEGRFDLSKNNYYLATRTMKDNPSEATKLFYILSLNNLAFACYNSNPCDQNSLTQARTNIQKGLDSLKPIKQCKNDKEIKSVQKLRKLLLETSAEIYYCRYMIDTMDTLKLDSMRYDLIQAAQYDSPINYSVCKEFPIYREIVKEYSAKFGEAIMMKELRVSSITLDSIRQMKYTNNFMRCAAEESQ